MSNLSLNKKFHNEIRPNIAKSLGYKNCYAAPTIKKIIVNIGIGRIISNKELVEKTKINLAKICGQKPSPRKAKKAIAGFKLRKGSEIGLICTLRGKRMWDFLEKIINIVLPRVRDFHGIKEESFDKQGNLTIGFLDQAVFIESIPETKDLPGLEVIIRTECRRNPRQEALVLFESLGIPIKKVKE